MCNVILISGSARWVECLRSIKCLEGGSFEAFGVGDGEVLHRSYRSYRCYI
jgi:hypothetical protein